MSVEPSLEQQLDELDATDDAAAVEASAPPKYDGQVAEPPQFIAAYPIAAVTPASYNPRFLSTESFERLQASLRRFGVVKPVILNANGTIIAGHQRTKALTAIGEETVAAIQLSVTIGTTDEIRFNLLHNSIEENGAMVFGPSGRPKGYCWLKVSDVVVGDIGRAAVRVANCSRLMAVYGAWGSVVIDPASGRVILNSDYAVACTQLRLPILAYYPDAAEADELRAALGGEYGIYDTSQIQDRPWVQNVVQPNRLREGVGTSKGRRGYQSRVWDTLALPRMARTSRVLDFGAGKMDYVNKLAKEGWDVRAYEPFVTTMTDGGLALDLATIVRQIVKLNREVRRAGLFDVVVLDSVLNATSTNDYLEAVLTTVGALLKPTGVLCLGTRSLARQDDASSAKSHRGSNQGITYLDPKTNRAINFKGGQFYAMWFATTETLREQCSRMFDAVHVEDTRNATILAVCGEPRPVTEQVLRAALEAEFGMAYPNDYRHNKQGPLVEAIVEANRELGRLL